MGKKAHPYGLRLGLSATWKSRWFSDKHNYQDLLLQDLEIREYLMDKLKTAGIARVDIERMIRKIKIIIYVSRPGVVIGRGGSNLEVLNKDIQTKLKIKEGDAKAIKLELKVEEIKKPDLQARLVAQRIVDQILGRYPYRRAIAQAIEKTIQAGALGVKVRLAGRINGADIARKERFGQGSVPAQTLRANIDYAEVPALTKSGYIGVKVWIYKGEAQL